MNSNDWHQLVALVDELGPGPVKFYTEDDEELEVDNIVVDGDEVAVYLI